MITLVAALAATSIFPDFEVRMKKGLPAVELVPKFGTGGIYILRNRYTGYGVPAGASIALIAAYAVARKRT